MYNFFIKYLHKREGKKKSESLICDNYLSNNNINNIKRYYNLNVLCVTDQLVNNSAAAYRIGKSIQFLFF